MYSDRNLFRSPLLQTVMDAKKKERERGRGKRGEEGRWFSCVYVLRHTTGIGEKSPCWMLYSLLWTLIHRHVYICVEHRETVVLQSARVQLSVLSFQNSRVHTDFVLLTTWCLHVFISLQWLSRCPPCFNVKEVHVEMFVTCLPSYYVCY